MVMVSAWLTRRWRLSYRHDIDERRHPGLVRRLAALRSWRPRASVHSHGVPSGDSALHDAAREADARGGDAKTWRLVADPPTLPNVLIFSAAMGAAQWQTSRMTHPVRLRLI
jgi:hypothetical protein